MSPYILKVGTRAIKAMENAGMTVHEFRVACLSVASSIAHANDPGSDIDRGLEEMVRREVMSGALCVPITKEPA